MEGFCLQAAKVVSNFAKNLRLFVSIPRIKLTLIDYLSDPSDLNVVRIRWNSKSNFALLMGLGLGTRPIPVLKFKALSSLCVGFDITKTLCTRH